MIGSFFVFLGASFFTLALMLNPQPRVQSAIAFCFEKIPEPWLYFGGVATLFFGVFINVVS